MSESAQRFGGSHTGKKLDAVSKYLQAYVTVMKNQNFNLTYVDGFAGSGESIPKSQADNPNGPSLFDLDAVVKGSPVRALDISPSFDSYIFIDADRKNVDYLNNIKSKYYNHSIEIEHGDANEKLIQFSNALKSKRHDRSVVFLDPFGLSVRWDTITALASTEKVDLWYLVPVHAMSRQVSKSGTFVKDGAAKVDDLWGYTEWREQSIKRIESSGDLFGHLDSQYEKTANAQIYSEMFRDRLATIFKGGVAEAYLKLGPGKSHHYSLMFACANPSKSAYNAALRIANHILKMK